MLRRVFSLLLIAAAMACAADISGKWNFSVHLDAGSGQPVFTFEQSGEKLTGKYSGAAGEADLAGTVKGGEVQFTFEANLGGGAVKVAYQGTLLSDGTMKGTADYGGQASGTWTAERAQ